MSQHERRSTEQLLQQAKSIHRTVKINSYDLQNKLAFMAKQIEDHSSFLTCSFCSFDKLKVDEGFKRAFKKLNLSQQVTLFWRMCTYIKKIKQQGLENTQILKGQRQMLDTTIYIKDKHEYPNWTVTRITISLRNKKINITDKSIMLDMHDYLLRVVKSQQKQKCFAIESKLSNQKFKTIKFSNQGTTFEELYQFFKKVYIQTIKDQIREILSSSTTNNIEVKVARTIGQKDKQTKSVKNMIPITQKIYRKQTPLRERMMTLKLISPEYASTSVKIIEKQMLERERVIRIKDQSYNEIYKVLVPKTLLENLDDLSGYKKVKQTQNYMAYYNVKQNKVKKKIKFKCSQIVIFDWLVDELNNFSNFFKWKTNMDSIKCLKIFPSEKTKLFHQVYKQDNKKINYLYIRHHFDLPEVNGNTNNKKVYCFYDQSVTMELARSYFKVPQPIAQISYIIWKFIQINDCIQLIIQSKCDHFQKDNNCKWTENFLGEFQKLQNNILNNDYEGSQIYVNSFLFENQYIDQINQIEDTDNGTEYFTVTDELDVKSNSFKGNNQDKGKNIKQTSNNFNKIQQRQSVSFLDADLKNKGNLVKFKHPVLPYKKGKPLFKQPKTGNHPQWQTEWKITPKGQLININKQKIQAQNSVMKNVLKSLGRNFMSGKSILNVSLPVDVFGDDSNLSRLCHSYGYAPMFLEAAVTCQNPVDRFRNVIAFALTASVCYLRMDKPFNPILGETCQIMIDGCPVYGEQISHHPPISAIFMKGRGYTIYGHLQAKVQMSLNSASGINSGQICVSFDSENLHRKRIRYTGPPGQLSGVVYGERKMALIKSSYFVDEENYLFCQLRWGKQKGKSEYSKNFQDCVEGTIHKLKSKVDIQQIKSVKKDDIESEIGLINGRWTGAVYYNTELILDTYQTFPYLVENYEERLESDVENRKDLLLRRNQPNLEKAQAAKQELEEIQRRDRKLRAEYNKNSKH